MEKQQLASLVLEIFDFGNKEISVDDLINLIYNYYSDYIQDDISLKDLLYMDLYMWRLNPFLLRFKKNECTAHIAIKIFTQLLTDSGNDNEDIFKFKKMLIIVMTQIIDVSLINRLRIFSNELIDLFLNILHQSNNDWVNTSILTLISKFSDMGLTPHQLSLIYEYCYNNENYSHYFHSLFGSENTLDNSLIFDNNNSSILFPNLSILNSKSSFILSTWLKLSHSSNFMVTDNALCSFPFITLNKEDKNNNNNNNNNNNKSSNNNLNIAYTIENSNIKIITATDEQVFTTFKLELDTLYNISFAHISEGKKKLRIDMFVNGLLIETKVIDNIFTNSAIYRTTLFKHNKNASVVSHFDLKINGPTEFNNVILEISSLYIIETNEYLHWILYLYIIGASNLADFEQLNFLQSLTSAKQFELNLLINNYSTNFNMKQLNQIHLKRDDIIFTWTSILNLFSKNNTIKYKYNSSHNMALDSIDIGNLFIKNNIFLMDAFNSIGGYLICLVLIKNSKSNDSLLNNIQFLFSMLNHDKILESKFISNSGYDILAALLKSKKEFITIEILDAVLKFVGYDNIQPSNSIMKNRIAYKSLILNFDLWQCPELSRNKIINKFLLFQFTVFIESSKYHEFNTYQVSDMKLIKRLLLGLKREDFLDDVLPIVSDIIRIGVKVKRSSDIVKLLLLHVIFTINVINIKTGSYLKQQTGGELILEIVKDLVDEQPKLLRAFNYNFLISLLKGSKVMKRIGLGFIIDTVGSSSKDYSQFLSIGGFSMITNLLKSDWDNNDILVLIFFACFKMKPNNPDNLTINMIVFLIPDNVLNQLYMPHFLGVLNNLMKFAAISLTNDNSSNAVNRLNNYIDMLVVLKRKSNFDDVYFKNEEWLGNLLFLVMVIKKSKNEILIQKYSKFLNEILVDRLYMEEKEERLCIIEKLYGNYQIEFNAVMIPLLFEKMKSFQSLSILIFDKSIKCITLCKIFICYLQSFSDVNIDNSLYLSNFDILIVMLKKIINVCKKDAKLLPFLKVLIKEFRDSFITIFMFYVNNVAHLTDAQVSAKLTFCCQIFMSNPDIMGNSLNNSTFMVYFTTFFKLITNTNSLSSLGLNCLRVLLLEKQHLEDILDKFKIPKKEEMAYINILKNILTFDDEQVLNCFAENNVFTTFIESVYTKNFEIYSESPLFDSGPKKYDSYISEKYKLEKSTKILKRDVEPFNKAIFNGELKNISCSIQDDLDDFHHFMNVYESLTGNLSFPHADSNEILYPTEGRNRKRNKIINVSSNDYSLISKKNFQKGNQGQIELEMIDSETVYIENKIATLSMNHTLNDFNIASKVYDDEQFDEDRNRRILRNLFVHDQIDIVYNVSRIVGLDAIESILVIGIHHIYIVEGYFYKDDGEICCSYEAPDDQRDSIVKLLTSLTISTQYVETEEPKTFRTPKSKSWSLKNIVSISKRKFLLRDVGFELFFKDGFSVLLTCINNSKRNNIFNKINSRIITKLEDSNLDEALKLASEQKIKSMKNALKKSENNGFNFVDTILSGSSDISSSNITSKWCNGEISNFQYLMLLNTIAGRTFNDLTQYPVFPFVLNDYNSETIDLTDPRVYRNLSKPMGAQNIAREQQFKDRYEATKEMSVSTPPFHYGTHYSSAMIVTSYLIRLYPFTESYLKLQGGKFDHPDRLFYSIPKLWNSASNENTTDVRELIPEFYYLPEFLKNNNKIKFGKLQDGKDVNDVELPPWANNDPVKFVRIMREALESEYVSKHLPEWIDLIFGYKQQGIEAIKATNVFHYLSYPGGIDIDKIHDEHERAVVISIIHNFGQTPLQIFRKKHPSKNTENYLNRINLKDNFLMNFENKIENKNESNHKIQNNCSRNINKLLFNKKNKKWVGIMEDNYLYIQDNYILKIERENLNGICINDSTHFQQFTIGGYISCIEILSKDRFIVGYNTGNLNIFEYSNDRYKYITNAQRSMVKMNDFISVDKNDGFFSNINRNKNKNYITNSNNEFLLLDICDLINGHDNEIIKIKYLKEERIIITLDSKRKWLTIWHEADKVELMNGEIYKMIQIKIDDYYEDDDFIIDFDINEDENNIYCITNNNRLIIWRIYGEMIFNDFMDRDIFRSKSIKLCEFISDDDYNYGNLFIVEYLRSEENEEDGEIVFDVFNISEDFEKLEKIIRLDVGDIVNKENIKDYQFLNISNKEFLVVLGTTDGIKFIK